MPLCCCRWLCFVLFCFVCGASQTFKSTAAAAVAAAKPLVRNPSLRNTPLHFEQFAARARRKPEVAFTSIVWSLRRWCLSLRAHCEHANKRTNRQTMPRRRSSVAQQSTVCGLLAASSTRAETSGAGVARAQLATQRRATQRQVAYRCGAVQCGAPQLATRELIYVARGGERWPLETRHFDEHDECVRRNKLSPFELQAASCVTAKNAHAVT